MADDAGREAASVTWTWLLACQDCGQEHVYTLHDPEHPQKGGSWAAPGVYPGTSGSIGGPGHAYRPRLHRHEVSRLWLLWQAEHEQAAARPMDGDGRG